MKELTAKDEWLLDSIDAALCRKVIRTDRTTGELMIDMFHDYIPVPRFLKSVQDQKARTKNKAEVCTPSRIVDKMVSALIEEDPKGWHDPDKTWLEICCGEGTFLTTRYDMVSGEYIPPKDRVGVLDRRLLDMGINIYNPLTWIAKATRILKSTYGYEYQTDSLLLARANLLNSMIEHYVWWITYRGADPTHFVYTIHDLDVWADIISWNIIRMDGLTQCIPETNIRAKIMNWETGEPEEFPQGDD